MKAAERFTDRYESLLSLSPAQALAVEVLDAGGSHAEAAAAASVDRTTVSKWASKHPGFVAEMNRRRVDRARANDVVLSKMDLKALSTIGEAIEAGDVPVSVQWFKMRGFSRLTEVPDGPTDADGVVESRMRGLSSLQQDFAERSQGRTVFRAIDMIWAEMEGAVGPGDEAEPSWEELLPDMEPGEF